MPESTDLELRRMGDSADLSDDELARLIRISKDLAASQMFKGAQPDAPITAHEAFAKILIGRDLGITPTQALMSVDMVRGNIQMRSVLLASFVRKSADYDYEVLEHDDTHCKIEFSHRGKPAGISEFARADADKAGLTRPTRKGEPSMYDKHPRNMYWARAMGNGVRWYCPDLTGGVAVYTEADSLEDAPSSLTAGEGSGDPVGWQGIDVHQAGQLEGVLQRAKDRGHAGLANRAAVELVVNGQDREFIAGWIESANDELSRMKVTPERAQEVADVVADAAEAPMHNSDPERLRAAGWYETEEGLWTAEGVAVPMNLSGALKILAAIEASGRAEPILGQTDLGSELDAQAAEESEA